MKAIVPATVVLLVGVTAGFLSAKAGRVTGTRTKMGVHGGAITVTAPPSPSPTEDPRQLNEQITWSRLDSEEIPQLVTNLRAVACPEQTIADIVRARILSAYQAKINAAIDPLARYWSTTAEARRTEAQGKEILTERDRLLAENHVQDSGYDVESGLGPEAQRHVAEALRQFPWVMTSPGSTPEEWDRAMAARQDRVRYLAGYLTPDELLTYRITQDGRSGAIEGLLRGIEPTEEEFRRVFAVLDSNERVFSANNPETQAKLKDALGPERYGDYISDLNSGGLRLRSWADSAGLSDDQIRRVMELRASSDTMDPQQYRRAVEEVVNNPHSVGQFFSNPMLYRARRK